MNPELQLQDIHLPDPVGWWPPAPGWWLLAVLVPLALASLYWLYKRVTRKTAVKTARKLFAALQQNPVLDEQQKVAELSVLFRRTAVSLFPRSESAHLTGDAWLEFLQRPMKDNRFTNGPGHLLIEAPYRREAPAAEDVRALFKLYEEWLKAVGKQNYRTAKDVAEFSPPMGNRLQIYPLSLRERVRVRGSKRDLLR